MSPLARTALALTLSLLVSAAGAWAEDGANGCLDPSAIEAGGATFGAAEACRAAGEVDRALELYGRLRREDPTGTEAPFWQGTLLRRRGEMEDALEAFDETLRRNPDHVDALVGRARVLLRLGDLKAAEASLDHAAALSPDNGEIREVRGTLLRWRGDTEGAAREYESALEASPRNVDAKLGLARTEWARGRPERGLTLAREVLEQTPGYDEAVTVAARSLEALGRDAEAYDDFLEGLRRRPENEESWRGLWRTAPTARPNFSIRFRDYDSRVIEGRGNPDSDPIRTRYSGFRLIEEARIPIDEHWAWTIESEQFEDELEQRTVGFTVYDVFGFSATTGIEARPTRDWSFTAGAGGAAFDSRTADPVDPEQLPLAHATARWSPSPYGLDVEVGYHRGYLFGRSIAGDLDFAIFAEDRLAARAEKHLGGPWTWRGAASYLHYDDGTEPTLASTGITFDRHPVTLVVYGDYSPIQTYFLKPGNRLDFVEVASLATRGKLEILEWLETRGGVRGSSYSDSNDEVFAWGETLVHNTPIPFLRFGLRYEIRDFQRNSSLYSSYDYDQWGPVIGVGGTIVPRLDFDVEYAHGFRDETFVSSFDEDSVRWSFELFLNPTLRIGTDGEWAEDDLPQKRRRIGAFARAVF